MPLCTFMAFRVTSKQCILQLRVSSPYLIYNKTFIQYIKQLYATINLLRIASRSGFGVSKRAISIFASLKSPCITSWVYSKVLVFSLMNLRTYFFSVTSSVRCLRMLRISLFASLLLVMAWMIKKENFPSVKSSQNPLAELYCKTGQYKRYQL